MQSQLAKFAKAIHSFDPDIQFHALQGIRLLSSIKDTPPLQDIFDSGVVSRLVEFLTYYHRTEIQVEAAWTILNLAADCNHPEYVATLVQQGAVEVLVELLRSKHTTINDYATGALLNIAGESLRYRDYALHCHVVDPLLKFLQDAHANPNTSAKHVSLLRSVVGCLSNLLRYAPLPVLDQTKSMVDALVKMVVAAPSGPPFSDTSVQIDACFGLVYFMDNLEEEKEYTCHKQSIPWPEVCEALYSTMRKIDLEDDDPQLAIATLRLLTLVCTGPDMPVRPIGVATGFWGVLCRLVLSKNILLLRQIGFLLARVVSLDFCGDRDAIHATGLFDIIVESAKTTSDPILKRSWLYVCLFLWSRADPEPLASQFGRFDPAHVLCLHDDTTDTELNHLLLTILDKLPKVVAYIQADKEEEEKTLSAQANLFRGLHALQTHSSCVEIQSRATRVLGLCFSVGDPRHKP